MKKFVFTLENVLRFKTESLGLLKSEMSRIRARISELEAGIASVRREYADQNRALVKKMEAGTDPGRIAVYKAYFTELDRRERKLESRKQAAEQAARIKQAEIVRMKSDISGLEKLRDKQRRAYEAQDRKEQERMIEEFVSRPKVPGISGRPDAFAL